MDRLALNCPHSHLLWRERGTFNSIRCVRADKLHSNQFCSTLQLQIFSFDVERKSLVGAIKGEMDFFIEARKKAFCQS